MKRHHPAFDWLQCFDKNINLFFSGWESCETT